MRLTDHLGGGLLIRSAARRYAFAVCAVGVALGLRILLLPLTGKGAPFVLFFGATLVTSLVAGVRPALLSLALSLPVAGYEFVVRAGYPLPQAVAQGCLYAIDGLIIVYLTLLGTRRRQKLEEAHRQLEQVYEQREQSLTRLRETLDLAPDAYFLAGLDARYVDVNQAACKLLGYERDELIGMTIMDIVAPGEAARLEAEKRDLMVPGRVSKAEWTLRRKDGSLVPTEVSANILPEGRWQAFVRDITEARRVREEREQMLAREQAAREDAELSNARLRESEERFRLTIDEAPIGMALVALDGRWVRVNRVVCELTGYSADELQQLTYKDITHPDDLDTDVELAEKLARGEIPRYQLEKRYVRKDHTFVDVMLHTSMLRRADGEALYYIAQIEDITERKRAAEALRLSEAKFSGIISIAADAIISVDHEQRIVIFNEGAEEIFGYDRSEVLGGPLSQLIPERYHASHEGHFQHFAADDVGARRMGERLEIYGLRKNGQEFPAEASISKVGVNGTTLFSVVLRDVTERKNVEAALQRAIDAREDVLGIVAHDLRNPLNTIMMQAQLLERVGPEPERRNQKPRLVIMRSAERLQHLIQDLLDVALVEEGQLKVEPERLSAPQVLHEAMELHTEVAAAKGLQLLLDVGHDVADVWADRSRLLQAFENLIGNALKFTDEGGRITIGANARNGEVEFFVADTGPGIAPDNVPHLFERFWQARRHERQGAGLGLAITRGIVEAHGGHIRVESTPGRGSTFFFTIPVPPNKRPADALSLKRPGSRLGLDR